MARPRMINPSIWDDPSFAELSVSARLLFIGLISNADDEGYLRGHAGAIKRLVFGMDEVTASDTQVLINEIANHIPSVHTYTAEDGQTYIHLANWFKYQHQQKSRIQPSLYPVCSKCLAGDKQVIKEIRLDEIRLDKKKLGEGNAKGNISATPTVLDEDELREAQEAQKRLDERRREVA